MSRTLRSIDIRSRGDKWALQNSGSCKDFVEFHGSQSQFFSGYVRLAVSIFQQCSCLWIFFFFFTLSLDRDFRKAKEVAKSLGMLNFNNATFKFLRKG